MMRCSNYLWLCLLVAFGLRANAEVTTKPAECIVFLGDSITDGNTYPLLIHQALTEAGKPVPLCINAGIGGNTAADEVTVRTVRIEGPTDRILERVSIGAKGGFRVASRRLRRSHAGWALLRPARQDIRSRCGLGRECVDWFRKRNGSSLHEER